MTAYNDVPARYRVGGLLIESNVSFAAPAADDLARNPEVWVMSAAEHEVSPLPDDELVLEVAQAGRPWLEVFRGRDGYLVRWPGLIDICVPDVGNSMRVRIRAEMDENASARILCQALSFLLDAHGREGLHATTVELNGRAVILAGSFGRGKVVLSDALYSMGARPFSSDLSVLRLDDVGRPVVESGLTGLRTESSNALGASDNGHMAGAGMALPLQALYVLGAPAGQPMVSEPLRGAEALAAFVGSVFNMVVASPRRLGVQFQIGTAIAEHAHVERVSWRPGPENARILAERLVHELADAGSSPASRNGNVQIRAPIPAGGLAGPGADSWRDRDGTRRQIVALLRDAGAGEEVENGMDEPLLRTSQVAALLRSSDRTVRSWADAGKLKYVKTLGGRRLFPASAVLSALRAMTGVAKEEEG